MQLTIISPQKVVAKIEDVEKIIAPTIEGEITVLPEHENLVGVIAMGEIIAETKTDVKYKFYVDRGVFKIFENEVTILSDYAETDSKSIKDEIQNAIEKAESTVATNTSLSYEVLSKLEKQLRFQRFVRDKISG